MRFDMLSLWGLYEQQKPFRIPYVNFGKKALNGIS